MSTRHIDTGERDFVFDSWLGGGYLDRWTVVHALFGVFAGAGSAYFGFPFWKSFGLMFLAAAVWEGYEISRGIYEPWSNNLTDLIAPAVMFPFFYYAGVVDGLGTLFVFIASLALFLVLDLIGWYSWKRRVGDF